jgi:hypothetical protein
MVRIRIFYCISGVLLSIAGILGYRFMQPALPVEPLDRNSLENPQSGSTRQEFVAYVKIADARIVWEAGHTHYSCICEGTTNLPDGAYVQIGWTYLKTVYPLPIAESTVVVHKGQFRESFGPIPQKKQILPGSYQILVFFAPGLQRDNALAHLNFAKDVASFTSGEEAEYAALWSRQHQEILEMLPDIQSRLRKIEEAYERSVAPEGLLRWHRGQTLRESWIQSVKQREAAYYDKYLTSLFAKTAHHLRPLSNLLEMVEEAATKAIQGEGEQLLTRRREEFSRLYAITWNDFRYEAIALSPSPAPSLLEEVRACQKRWQEMADPEGKADTLKPEVTAGYIVRIYHAYQAIQKIQGEPSSAFIHKSNKWLWELRQLFQEFERECGISPQEKSRLPAICYTLGQALLAEWEKLAGQAGIFQTPAETTSGSFVAVWQKAVSTHHLSHILSFCLERDAEWMRRHVKELAEELKNEKPSSVWADKVAAWHSEILERQNFIRLFASLAPEKSNRVLSCYCRLSAYLINFYDLTAQYWDKKIPYRLIATELERLEEQISFLQEASQEK